MRNTPNGIVKNPDSKYVKDKNEISPDEPLFDYHLLKELVFAGVRYSYASYDFKKAFAEYRIQFPHLAKYNGFDFVSIPDDLQEKHRVWRTGKLREVYFDRDGKMCRFKIGCRFYKNFTLQDFGVTVKPMIFATDDEHNLIGQGLAVQDTM